MNKLDLKGLWIPAEVLLNEELSDKEKIILSMVLYLSKDTGHCFATNNYFSDILNVTVVSISRIINSLKKKNYIKVDMKYKSNSKEIENRQIIPLNKVINRHYQNCGYPIIKNDKKCYQNCKIPINKDDKNIIINNIKNKKYIGREYSNEFLESLYANV